MDKVDEALTILQEECAEVIVEVSKIKRFGLDSVSWKTNIGHRETLEIEVGDVLAMVEILIDQGILNPDRVHDAIKAKKEKLRKFSKIFADTDNETSAVDIS
jgi:NTP pyrophosphatase (non-canonical NTP hydrolase)